MMITFTEDSINLADVSSLLLLDSKRVERNRL